MIVTKDEITDPHALKLGTKVNGEVRQNSSTNQIIFKTPKLIEFISSYVTLDPGDMIFTGTPPGVGFGMNPPQYLKPGDVIEVWVEKIGSLTNAVVAFIKSLVGRSRRRGGARELQLGTLAATVPSLLLSVPEFTFIDHVHNYRYPHWHCWRGREHA